MQPCVLVPTLAAFAPPIALLCSSRRFGRPGAAPNGLSVAAMLTASVVMVNAEGQAHKGHASGSQLSGSVQIVFSTDDVRVIREYYAPRYRALPPGLQKKYARTGQLPPGWQKKLEPFDPVVERRLVTLPAGYRRGIVDGRAVIMDDRTHVLIDMAVVF